MPRLNKPRGLSAPKCSERAEEKAKTYATDVLMPEFGDWDYCIARARAAYGLCSTPSRTPVLSQVWLRVVLEDCSIESTGSFPMPNNDVRGIRIGQNPNHKRVGIRFGKALRQGVDRERQT